MIYNTVIFDVGGVLHAGVNREHLDNVLGQEFGLSATQINRIGKLGIDPLSTGKITEHEFWQRLAKEFRIRKVDPSEKLLIKPLMESFAPHQKIYGLIKQLKKQGLKLVVLSNTIDAHARFLKSKKVYEPFDFVFLSNEIGLRKPDPEAYRHVLDQLKLKPVETIFVDDTPKNVDAAKAIGIRSVLFENEQQVVDELRAYLLPAAKGNAEIILVRKDGALILQHRDDKPGIANPGLITTFGGGIEADETPLEAAVREVNEETSLKLSPTDLEFFAYYGKNHKIHGEDWDVYYFIAKNISDRNFKVYEGQGYAVVKNVKQLKKIETSILANAVLKDYYAKFA